MELQVGYTTLSITIKNSEPVELSDFAQSMLSLSDDYTTRYTSNPKQPAKLYIKELRNGSIIAELAPLLAFTGDLLGNFDSIKSYAEYLSETINWLLGKDKKPENINQHQMTNIAHIVNPVAQDHGAQMNIGVINVEKGGTVNVININSNDANIIQNRAREERKQLQNIDKTVEAGEYKNVLMYWERIAKETDTDRAIIESISKKPVKVLMPEEIKEKIGLTAQYPFQYAHIVDVMVETIEGKPKLYKIIKYHESFEE